MSSKQSTQLKQLTNIVRYLINTQGENTSREEQRENGSYEFIPQSTHYLLELFTKLPKILNRQKSWYNNKYDGYTTKFLDAGCGIGNVLLIAHFVAGFNFCHGIEYFSETIEQAIKWLGVYPGRYNDHGMKIIQDNILTFSDYSKYDVIYYYCPFTNHLKEKEFEERLENEARVGTAIIGLMKQSSLIRKDKRFRQLSIPTVYLKVRD
jgi:SAM-dependent methyltransferase